MTLDIDKLRRDLIAEEALRMLVYDDATGSDIEPGTLVHGHPTIGVGRCLDRTGISRLEALTMLDTDIDGYITELMSLPWFQQLDDIRQRAILNMRHQLGLAGLLRFHDMIGAIERGDFTEAASCGLSSPWATQTPQRALRVMAMLRTGQDNPETPEPAGSRGIPEPAGSRGTVAKS